RRFHCLPLCVVLPYVSGSREVPGFFNSTWPDINPSIRTPKSGRTLPESSRTSACRTTFLLRMFSPYSRSKLSTGVASAASGSPGPLRLSVADAPNRATRVSKTSISLLYSELTRLLAQTFEVKAGLTTLQNYLGQQEG